MTSSRFILIFLGFIFLIIIILSSSRISSALQKRAGTIFPSLKFVSTPTPSPSPSPTRIPIQPPTETPKLYNSGSTSTPTGEIPATGPEMVGLLFLSGSFLTGISLRKLTKTT